MLSTAVFIKYTERKPFWRWAVHVLYEQPWYESPVLVLLFLFLLILVLIKNLELLTSLKHHVVKSVHNF